MYLRFHVLKAKEFKPVVAKEKNMLDLRPAIIAKLQQLVKDGSNGLYILNIDKINPDVINSKLDVVNASLHIDTAVMRSLDKVQKLPEDIFNIKFNTLHIDGIGIDNFLHKDKIDVSGIFISRPVIEMYHNDRPYNKEERQKKENLSLYKRILGTMKSIALGKVSIQQGTFVLHQHEKNSRNLKLNDVGINLNKILIDSTTQFDHDRFLFAKTANFSAKNYFLPTPDSLYVFSVGSINISADQHSLTAGSVQLKAKGGKKEFLRKIKERKELYDLTIPKITLNGVNWLAILNNEKFLMKNVDLFSPAFSVYLDRSIPQGKTIEKNSFPHQLLLKFKVPIEIAKLNLHNLKIRYDEFSPAINRTAGATFDRINGQITNISNLPGEISKHPIAVADVKGIFEHTTPAMAKFQFFLNKPASGDFIADVQMDTLNNYTVNPISEPLALFTVKRGQLQKGKAHVEGNIDGAKASVALEYTKLHITPLKPDSGKDGKLKEKHITSFLANKLLIKDNNPGNNGELRKPEYTVVRDHHGNFFNFIWVSILTGMLKTIGIPVKFVLH